MIYILYCIRYHTTLYYTISYYMTISYIMFYCYYIIRYRYMCEVKCLEAPTRFPGHCMYVWPLHHHEARIRRAPATQRLSAGGTSPRRLAASPAAQRLRLNGLRHAPHAPGQVQQAQPRQPHGMSRAAPRRLTRAILLTPQVTPVSTCGTSFQSSSIRSKSPSSPLSPAASAADRPETSRSTSAPTRGDPSTSAAMPFCGLLSRLLHRPSCPRGLHLSKGQ